MFYYASPSPKLVETSDGVDEVQVGGIRLNSVAMLASVITLLGYLPQVWKVATTLDVGSFSTVTLIANCVASIMWVVFGFANDIPANILSGVVFLFMNLYFLGLVWRRGSRP